MNRKHHNIGTHDLSDPDITIEQMIQNYDRILTDIQEKFPGVELYLMAYYPINYDAATAEMKPCKICDRTGVPLSESHAFRCTSMI